jgi:hypothetical protein
MRPHSTAPLVAALCVTAIAAVLVLAPRVLTAEPAAPRSASSWKADRAWNQGQAEFALYDAVRPLYGIDRHYDARIFTNKQYMNPETTTKASNWRDAGNIEVFKHNVSEMIPTENYTYRFLTTGFIRVDTLKTYKLAMSSQEDCGSTYKQFIATDGEVRARAFCYFPDAGARSVEYDAPRRLAFQDALSLRLRDYPFDASERPTLTLDLVPDQTDTHETSLRPSRATVSYVGRETITVPYGDVEAHHLRVSHDRDGGAERSEYWFADSREMRHVMVRYRGPYGVRYELRKLAWWAYWDRSQPEPN